MFSVSFAIFFLLAEIGPPTVNLNFSNASIEIQLTHPVKSLHEILKGLKYQIYVNDIKKETEVSF